MSKLLVLSGAEVSFQCRLPTNWLSDPSLCWFEWQTLVGGLLAVAAAAISVHFLRKQIAQTDQLHQKELERRHNAARTVVPVALAAISEFCNAVADQIATAIEDRNENDPDALWDAATSGRTSQEKLMPVNLSDEVIPTMKGFVETLSDRANVRHVAELLSSLQILQARLKDFDLNQIAAAHSLYGLLIDTAKVKLLTDSIYNYGRFLDENSFAIVSPESVPDSWKAILGKAQGLVYSRQHPDYFFPQINELISSYSDNEISPWNEKFVD